MQAVFNWFYQMLNNVISWLFQMQIVPNVTIGSFMVVLGISALVISNLVIIARR